MFHALQLVRTRSVKCITIKQGNSDSEVMICLGTKFKTVIESYNGLGFISVTVINDLWNNNNCYFAFSSHVQYTVIRHPDENA